MSKVASLVGQEGDATPFTDVTVDNVSSTLHRWGDAHRCAWSGGAFLASGGFCFFWCFCFFWTSAGAGWACMVSAGSCGRLRFHWLTKHDAPTLTTRHRNNRRHGYQQRGWEVMYNGHTGRMMDAQVSARLSVPLTNRPVTHPA
jgi:hypothetical protein